MTPDPGWEWGWRRGLRVFDLARRVKLDISVSLGEWPAFEAGGPEQAHHRGAWYIQGCPWFSDRREELREERPTGSREAGGVGNVFYIAPCLDFWFSVMS